jgi:hypothetical protein
MQPKRLLLHILGSRQDGQWTLLCLDFDLAVQSASLEDAEARLKSQIKGYLKDALGGDDVEHARTLLRRKAPARYWAMYYLYSILGHFRRNGRNGHISRHEPIPMVPA